MQSILRVIGYQAVSNDDVALQQTFAQHLSEFGISYGTKEEYDFRYDIFAKMDAEINEINN